MDGALLMLTALLLLAVVAEITGTRRLVLAAYLALMACYGLGNIANDAWLEQVVKRGWTAWEIPGVTTPTVNWAWGVILLAALGVWLAWRRRLVDAPMPTSPSLSARYTQVRRKPSSAE